MFPVRENKIKSLAPEDAEKDKKPKPDNEAKQLMRAPLGK